MNHTSSGKHFTMKKKIISAVLLVFIIAAIVITAMMSLRLDYVIVYGCIQKDLADVVACSGLSQGMSMYAIQEETVRRNIDTQFDLLFVDMERDVWNKTVTLTIYERVPFCVMRTLGIQCTVDVMGVIISKSEEITDAAGLITLDGIRLDDIRLGEVLCVTMENKQQLNAYMALAYEINRLECADMILAINLLKPDNIYLELNGGYMARLGNMTYLHAKLVSLITVLDYLEAMDISGGTIDVSIPVNPVHMPW